MSLLLPRHVFEARQAEKQAQPIKLPEVPSSEPVGDAAPATAQLEIRRNGIEIYDLDTPMPAYVPTPQRFLLAIMPVSVKDKIGSVWLPDSAIDAQMWCNGIGKVCGIGPGTFKGRRFEEMGLSEADAPKIGDLVIYNAKSPNRLTVCGKTLIYIADDAISATVDPAHAHLITF